MDIGIAVRSDLLDAFLVSQYLLKETCNHAESCGDKGANTIRRLWSNVQGEPDHRGRGSVWPTIRARLTGTRRCARGWMSTALVKRSNDGKAQDQVRERV